MIQPVLGQISNKSLHPQLGIEIALLISKDNEPDERVIKMDHHIFLPVQFGNLALKNRVALAPMTRVSASAEGLVTEKMLKYYLRFVRGGFGLLITEGIYIDESHSQGYLYQPGITNQAHIESWRKLTQEVHHGGGHIIAQIMHAGALTQGNRFTTERIAPSAVQPKGEQLGMYRGSGSYRAPREITKKEIQEVIDSFAKAAVHTREAGFDGVEIHGANGYILDQFLTDYTNLRADEYGGSTENRVRLSAEVIQKIRAAVGPDYPVGIRISQAKVNDYDHKWRGGESDAEIIFRRLAQAGADFIHVTEYDAALPAFGTGLTLAALAKKYGKVAVIANGNLEDPNKANALLEKGEADLVALGKGALANRDWPNRVLQGESIRSFTPEIFQPYADIKEEEL